MEYRGVSFSIVARPGKDEWRWTINHGSYTRTGTIHGVREKAVRAAVRAIDKMWEDVSTTSGSELQSLDRL